LAEQDELETQIMTKANWLPPVERLEQLPVEGVEEGTRCFVEPDDGDFEEVWVFRSGAWVHIDTL